jgi:hypothetical protein
VTQTNMCFSNTWREEKIAINSNGFFPEAPPSAGSSSEFDFAYKKNPIKTVVSVERPLVATDFRPHASIGTRMGTRKLLATR